MSYSAIVCKIKKVRPHPNADRLLLGDAVGYQVIVGLDTKEKDLGVFFSDDGCLSPRMLRENNLFTHSELNKDPDVKGYFDDNGRVRAQKLRGEKSYGFWTPLSSLEWTGADLSSLKDGDTFTELNGEVLCKKFVSRATSRAIKNRQKFAARMYRQRLRKKYPTFKKHFETEQLRYNLVKIPYNSIVYISEKLHGTSGRTGHLLTGQELNWFQKLVNKIKPDTYLPQFKYGFISGSRNVILEGATDQFYKNSTMREQIHDQIEKAEIHPGVTLFYEIVGFDFPEHPIMPRVSSSKIKDKKLRKEIEKAYGERITFQYGTNSQHPIDCWDWYVYRATYTTESGFAYELSWPQVEALCRINGFKSVPIHKGPFIYEEGVDLIEIAENYLDNPSVLDRSHICEGICVRIEDPTGRTTIYKDKGFIFKLLEGIIKDSDVVDTEELEKGEDDLEEPKSV